MRDMIVFGEDWGRHPSSTQHLIKRLAKDAKIIWVNSLGLRRPRLNMVDLDRLKTKALTFARPKQSGACPGSVENPFAAIINPRTIPWPGSSLAACLNRHILRDQIAPVLADNKMARPILWTSLPTALPAVGALNEHALVYYAGDDFDALAGVDHAPVLEMELQLARKADLIIAASPVIAERFASGKTQVLQHGVDYGLFASPAPRAADMPTGKPIAGFYGSLNNWIDIEAIAEAANALSDWNIVLIGKTETDVTRLGTCPNVHFLGPRAHASLPSYAQHWDVSLLPFRRNRQIDASNPLKMREYLAAGRPVLASYEFPATVPYRDAITVVEHGETLAQAILRTANDKRKTGFRQELVRHESWDERAATLKSWLEQL